MMTGLSWWSPCSAIADVDAAKQTRGTAVDRKILRLFQASLHGFRLQSTWGRQFTDRVDEQCVASL